MDIAESRTLLPVIVGMLRSWGLTIYGHGSIPGAPDIDAVTPGGGKLTIEWKAPTDTGETAITSYDLRYIRDDAHRQER